MNSSASWMFGLLKEYELLTILFLSIRRVTARKGSQFRLITLHNLPYMYLTFIEGFFFYRNFGVLVWVG